MGVILRVERLIDGTGAPPLNRAELLVEAGKVVSVGPQGSHPGDGHTVREYPGLTAIPGLIDLHVHFCYLTSGEFQKSQLRPNRVAMMIAGYANAKEWLHQGVTTARVVGTPFDLDIGLKEMIAERPALGPRLVTAGRMMTMTGGKRNPWDHMKDEVSGPLEAQRWTRAHLKEGADVIKLYCTTLLEENVIDYIRRALALPDDAPDPGRWGSLTPDEIRATVTEAHKAGRTVAAHTAPAFGVKLALLGGVDTVEHGSDMDDECIELFLQTGATLVPTLSIWPHQIEFGDALRIPKPFIEFAKRRWDKMQARLLQAYQAGVKIATGTDAVMDGMVFWTEVEILVDIGLPPMEAIRAATQRAAACMGQAGRLVGTLEPGKWADMTLLDGDPLTDIRHIRRVQAVLKAGEVVAEPPTSGRIGKEGHRG